MIASGSGPNLSRIMAAEIKIPPCPPTFFFGRCNAPHLQQHRCHGICWSPCLGYDVSWPIFWWGNWPQVGTSALLRVVLRPLETVINYTVIHIPRLGQHKLFVVTFDENIIASVISSSVSSFWRLECLWRKPSNRRCFWPKRQGSRGSRGGRC